MQVSFHDRTGGIDQTSPEIRSASARPTGPEQQRSWLDERIRWVKPDQQQHDSSDERSGQYNFGNQPEHGKHRHRQRVSLPWYIPGVGPVRCRDGYWQPDRESRWVINDHIHRKLDRGVCAIYDFSSSSNPISNNSIGAITINGIGTGTGGFRGIFLNTLRLRRRH